MEVKILFFVPDQDDLTEVASFKVPVDLEQLLDSGESFTVRGVFDNASLALTRNSTPRKGHPGSDQNLARKPRLKRKRRLNPRHPRSIRSRRRTKTRS